MDTSPPPPGAPPPDPGATGKGVLVALLGGRVLRHPGGAQVEIRNERNQVLAMGALESAGGCAYEFTVEGVPAGEKLYGASIGNANRGVIWNRAEGFALSLGG